MGGEKRKIPQGRKTTMKTSIYLAAALAFYGCGTFQESQNGIVDTVAIAHHLEVLASDAFEGRKPFTEGEKKTVEYLVKELTSFGLQPGNGNQFVQDVPMVELKAMPSDTMTFAGEKGTVNLLVGADFVAFNERVEVYNELHASDVVFAGFGIVAPEYGWNDYEGLDVKGKTVLVLVNDPGFGSGDSTIFKGETMTYYGRWTYKYEEAARQGAAGVLIIHDTAPAGYPWLVVSNSWTGSKLYLDQQGNGYQPVVQGWITRDAAIRIFETSSTDMKNYLEKARSKDFKPQELGLKASVAITNDIRKDLSHNVIARLEGTKHPDEYIIYSAHWDHFGIGDPIDGDSIYNGAEDNASGTATLLAIAETFASREEKPERSVLFLFVTGEEQGLLGAKYYAEHPIYPIQKTVANINMDDLKAYGPMKDFTIVGYGQSEMDEVAGNVARRQNRYVIPDPDPAKGYFFRSDHFQFAKVGIPALYGSGVYEHQTKGIAYVDSLGDDYTANRYHQPSDEFNPSEWRFRGIQQDADLFFLVGWELANSALWPKWKDGSEFKAVREQQP